MLLLCSCQDQNSAASNSENLQSIIDEYQNRNSYDYKKFPLGLYTKEHYASESTYAKEKLIELEKIDGKMLTETEQISLELLKFIKI